MRYFYEKKTWCAVCGVPVFENRYGHATCDQRPNFGSLLGRPQRTQYQHDMTKVVKTQIVLMTYDL